MYTFKEQMGSIFLLNDQGEAQYEVNQPCMVFDKDLFVLHKIGNQADVVHYYKSCIEKCKKTGSNLFESWIVMDLPMDAPLLDRILQRKGSLERILKEELKVRIDF